MRVCMLAYTFYESDNRVRRYAETLSRRGDSVDAVVLRREGQSSDEMIAGVRVHRIQRRVRDEKGSLSYLWKLLTFLARSAWVVTVRHLKSPYDVIHVHSVPDFEVFATVIPRLLGAKVFLDIHDAVPELYASKFNVKPNSSLFRVLVFIEKLSVRFANHVIVANHLWCDRIIKRSAVPPGHCSTILNYPDPALFGPRQRTDAPNGDFVICYPGTLSWHQGVDLVVRAVARLQHEPTRIRLRIFGDGSERPRLLALASDLGISDRVVITPGVPLEQVATMMANADLGVEPKRKRSFANEALSTKILEFMAVGVPVLAADTRTHKLYFEEGLVYFFESDNVDDLAEKILMLVRDAAARRAVTLRGLEYIRQCTWDVKKAEYLELVDAMASGARDHRLLRTHKRRSPGVKG